ncbi:MAG: nicotinamide-nucleotide adenylyltransferase [Candidatus Helarchaeota archaeon]|nr:nicotinamide-nucleotide adenylyltransferase [Candidatus Helarchaeota archaeon]
MKRGPKKKGSEKKGPRKRGLMIGRFQPVHLGHLKGIEEILGEVDDVIILIGSAQYSHSLNNPFTAGERISMVHEALKENKLDLSRIFIIPLMDTNDNRIWVAHLVTSVPSFDVAYTHNPLVKRLLFESNIEVKSTSFWNREIYNATEVRNRILNGGNWEELVPQSVAKIIKDISGVERIQQIGETTLKI